MKARLLGSLLFLAGAALGQASDEIFDRVEDALTWSAADARYRSRISGSLDLEGYFFPQPAPGLLHSDDHVLFNPRLTLFYDAQVGAPIYLFAQARVDRGFDPGAVHLRGRLDEYAIRFTPWRNGRFNLQVGKFATVVGNWVVRHGSWTNPFVTAPVAYENLTGLWDSEAIRSSNTLLQWSHVRRGLPASVTAKEKSLRIPIIWGPSYATGAAISGEIRRASYAFEVKEGAVSSRPEAWGRFDRQWDHPTASGRLGYRPNQMWNLGVSASTGTYLQPYASASLPAGRNLSDYRQTTLAHDVAFAWRHFQVWAEVTAARFQIPGVGDADTLAWYAEAKYKWTPRLSGAIRWNQQVYSRILDRGVDTRWGRNLWRLDVAPAWRFTSHTQAKLQYSLQEGGNGLREYSHVLATQLTVRF
jgi:hypothetical protein